MLLFWWPFPKLYELFHPFYKQLLLPNIWKSFSGIFQERDYPESFYLFLSSFPALHSWVAAGPPTFLCIARYSVMLVLRFPSEFLTISKFVSVSLLLSFFASFCIFRYLPFLLFIKPFYLELHCISVFACLHACLSEYSLSHLSFARLINPLPVFPSSLSTWNNLAFILVFPSTFILCTLLCACICTISCCLSHRSFENLLALSIKFFAVFVIPSFLESFHKILTTASLFFCQFALFLTFYRCTTLF